MPGERADRASQVRGRSPPDGGADRAAGLVYQSRLATDANGRDDNPVCIARQWRARTSPVFTGPVAPAPVVQDPLTATVGGTLDVTLPNLGLGTSGLTFTITPQPLPANMNFNRQTGELIFSPAPGQTGAFDFSVAVSNGSRSGTIVLPVIVTDPVLPSTEVSGQVVDENGNPLANMPVAIGDATAATNASGDFTLTNIPADPGPISTGGR